MSLQHDESVSLKASRDHFGQLRHLTQLPAHPARFELLLRRCKLAHVSVVEEQFVPYLQSALLSWPDEMRRAPKDWKPARQPGNIDALTWPLVRQLTLEGYDEAALERRCIQLDLTQITHLELKGCTLSEQNINTVIQALGPSLSSLAITKCKVSLRTFKRLVQADVLSGLKSLTFTVAIHFQPPQVSHKERHQKLVSILSDASFCATLRSLNLMQTPNDSGISSSCQIANVFPSLRHLGILYDQNIDMEQLASIMESKELDSLDLLGSSTSLEQFQVWRSVEPLATLKHLGLSLNVADDPSPQIKTFFPLELQDVLDIPLFSEVTSLSLSTRLTHRGRQHKSPHKLLQGLHDSSLAPQLTALQLDGWATMSALADALKAKKLPQLKGVYFGPKYTLPRDWVEQENVSQTTQEKNALLKLLRALVLLPKRHHATAFDLNALFELKPPGPNKRTKIRALIRKHQAAGTFHDHPDLRPLFEHFLLF